MILFRKFTFFIVLFLAYISIAYAASFDVSVTPIDDDIIIDEFATFQLNIKNNLEQRDEYRIYSLNFPTWDIRTEPIVNPITLELEPGEEGNVIGISQSVGQVGKNRPKQELPVENLYCCCADTGSRHIGGELAAESALRLFEKLKTQV